MNPEWSDHLSPEEIYRKELETNGEVTAGILCTRLCDPCKSYGLGKCTLKPHSANRSIMIRAKKNTHCGTCPICLVSVQNKSVVKTKCGHVFHKTCFIEWACTHEYAPPCPMCRTPLEDIWSDMTNE